MSIDIAIITPSIHHYFNDEDKHYTLHKCNGSDGLNQLDEAILANIKGLILTYSSAALELDTLKRLPKLQIISVYGAGYDSVPIDYCQQHKINVTNTHDILTNDTGDIALRLVLSSARKITKAENYLRRGQWQQGAFEFGTNLSGKTAGIIGLGRIGQAIAQRLAACDMNIAYYGRNPKSNVSYEFIDDKIALAKQSDFLIVSCPGGPQTIDIVDTEVLQALGPKGFLINISRGSTVNQQAVTEALQNKQIAGAGFDVFWNEPDVPSALLELDNVVVLPHIGSATVETRRKMGEMTWDNLASFFQQHRLINPVLDFCS